MSVTFNGAFTFSGGGFTATLAPPSTPTAGWYAGGYPGPVATVDRIIFATDTATATVRGPLSSARYGIAATGTTAYGWFGGDGFGNTNIDRITYATDSATASVRGTLSAGSANLAATGDNTTYGWFGGGSGPRSTVQRITFATDTAAASAKGPLSAARYILAAAGTSSYGWFGGGNNGSGLSVVDRIDYANDTATASLRGPLSVARWGLAASTDLSTYGWFGAGYSPATPALSTRVDRITYATDTATASVRGPLTLSRSKLAATNDTTYGWFGAGVGPSPSVAYTTVDRITYATDTATATVRGSLTAARYGLGASSGIQ
jgi:hypothetical protein